MEWSRLPDEESDEPAPPKDLTGSGFVSLPASSRAAELVQEAQLDDQYKLGSHCCPASIHDIESARSGSDVAFAGFRRRFTQFLNTSLPSYGYQLDRWITIPPDFQVSDSSMVRVTSSSKS